MYLLIFYIYTLYGTSFTVSDIRLRCSFRLHANTTGLNTKHNVQCFSKDHETGSSLQQEENIKSG